jgi:hypothetical protein
VGGVSDDSADHWPTFTLGPTEYEQAVADIARTMSPDITDWRVHHLDAVEGVDGTYVIDVTVRFQLAGMDFLVLFECKRHASAVKREHVQVLHTKMQSTGAQKGVVVAASGFQRGALQYAQAHGIACVRLVDEAWTYVSRSSAQQSALQPAGTYASYVITSDDSDYQFAMLSGSPAVGRSLLPGKSSATE